MDWGAGPLAFKPNSFCSLASQTIANKSPPMPLPVGSIRPKAIFAAMAASMAVPPFFNTSIPICVARG